MYEIADVDIRLPYCRAIRSSLFNTGGIIVHEPLWQLCTINSMIREIVSPLFRSPGVQRIVPMLDR